MKKVLAFCLALIMVFSMSAVAFAAPENFVPSPVKKKAPTVITFEPKDEDCTAKLVITPHSENETLPEVLQNLMEKAYEEVKTSTDLTTLCNALKKSASDKGVKEENLAVSDLFDIHVTGCDFHDGHEEFDIVLAADLLAHFVGLLHMQKDGSWELVEDAKVVGDHIHFSVESFSPFAVIVDTEDIAEEGAAGDPQTGDDSHIYLYLAIMVVSAVALVVIWRKTKKQKV